MNDNTSFRDTLSTVDQFGDRLWIYPKKPKGRYYNWRSWLSYVLLIFLFSAPFVKLNGEQLLLFNILERKFIIFGMIFWPQDFYLIVIGFLAMVIFLILFTVIYGRIFCGWVCPQTIFMEMVFRKIEYLIEGDFTRQKKLDKMPWNREKIFKKGLKHIIFYMIAFLIGNTFLAYIIGGDKVLSIVQHSPAQHPGLFVTIIIFSGIFYWIFAWFREQVCTIACPYGRLQGVLLDKESIVVAYDYIRGEPRGKLRKNKPTRELGDCIDCHQCVQVCPTGIDIRNGTQMECINCTACIDACDDIMDRIDKPRGLIRFASENQIAEKKPFRFNGRIIAYTVILVLLLGIFSSLMIIRTDVDTTILRSQGMLYQKTDDGKISNLYNVTLINKTTETLPITFKVENKNGTIRYIGDKMILKERDISKGVFFIDIPREELNEMSSKLEIGIYSNGKRIDTETTRFMGPP